MAQGLLLSSGLGGVRQANAMQYGSAPSYSSGLGASSAAFGGTFTTPTMSTGQMVTPTHGFGIAVWLGIGAIAALCWIRYSLPS